MVGPELIKELEKREAEAKVVPDSSLDAFMKVGSAPELPMAAARKEGTGSARRRSPHAALPLGCQQRTEGSFVGGVHRKERGE